MNEWVWSIDGMILTGKTEVLENNLSQCHCVLVRSDPDRPALRCVVDSTSYFTPRYRCALQGCNVSSSYTKNHDEQVLTVVVTRPIETNYEGCPVRIQPF